MSSQLFSPYQLRGVTLPNRIVVSPMCQYSAEDGSATDWHTIHLGQLAQSGVGLVILEATAVEARGRTSPGDLGLYSDANQEALARTLASVRKYAGPARMGVQLAHAGRKASAQKPWDGGKALSPEEGAWETVAPSATPFGEGWHTPKAADDADLKAIRDGFVKAAQRSLELGFDWIELHGAHGYLLHEFLSPLANQRTDEYGGSLENRMRFPLEIAAAVRAVWPEDRVLGMRLSVTDWAEGGLVVEEAVEVARRLRAAGLDYICTSSGAMVPYARIPIGPGYQVPFAERIKAEAGIATMAVGMIVDPHQAESVVTNGKADMVALARGLLDNPRWAWHAAEALGAKAYYPPQYERAQAALWPGAAIARPEKDAERKVA